MSIITLPLVKLRPEIGAKIDSFNQSFNLEELRRLENSILVFMSLLNISEDIAADTVSPHIEALNFCDIKPMLELYLIAPSIPVIASPISAISKLELDNVLFTSAFNFSMSASIGIFNPNDVL